MATVQIHFYPPYPYAASPVGGHLRLVEEIRNGDQLSDVLKRIVENQQHFKCTWEQLHAVLQHYLIIINDQIICSVPLLSTELNDGDCIKIIIAYSGG